MKAIVTGHTRGLGAAIVANLLARGITVLGVSRNRNAELEKQFPSALEQAQVDLSDLAALVRWLDSGTLQRFVADAKGVLLINNAGTMQPVGPLQMQDAATVAQAVALNVGAPLALSSALATASRASQDMRIVHLSSGAARNAYPGWNIYCATKAALDHHARAVALDNTPHLRICSVAPGVIDTDMQTQIRASTLEQFPMRERFDDMKRNGQLSSPEEGARKLVDYALSEQFGQLATADLREVAR